LRGEHVSHMSRHCKNCKQDCFRHQRWIQNRRIRQDDKYGTMSGDDDVSRHHHHHHHPLPASRSLISSVSRDGGEDLPHDRQNMVPLRTCVCMRACVWWMIWQISDPQLVTHCRDDEAATSRGVLARCSLAKAPEGESLLKSTSFAVGGRDHEGCSRADAKRPTQIFAGKKRPSLRRPRVKGAAFSRYINVV